MKKFCVNTESYKIITSHQTEADVLRKIENGDVAYNKIVLDFVMGNIGEMCEFAVNIMGYPLDLFIGMFAKSKIAKKMSDGNQQILGGKMGTEIAYAVEEEFKGCIIFRGHSIPPIEKRSRLYEFGKSLAYYQWYSKIPWAELFSKVSVFEFLRAYLSMVCGSNAKYCVKINGIMAEREEKQTPPYVIWQNPSSYETEKKSLCLK